jgi:hypothetical protein
MNMPNPNVVSGNASPHENHTHSKPRQEMTTRDLKGEHLVEAAPVPKARTKQPLNPLDDGHVLVRSNEREHPGHSEILRERLDALARYLGHGNYEPSSKDARRLRRARRLWARAYSNYCAMLSDPVWWRTNARNQYPIVFPADDIPPHTTAA